MTDQAKLNNCKASRKADRETIAVALVEIAANQGAKVTRRDESRNLGYHGASIHFDFECNGVGAMVNIDDLHGGDYALISWFNHEYTPRNLQHGLRLW